MKSQTLDNSRISKHLGQTSQYKSTYDRSLLVREPRQSNRTHLNINDDDLGLHLSPKGEMIMIYSDLALLLGLQVE